MISKRIRKTVCLASFVLTIVASSASSYAGPALSFIFDHVELGQSQCMQKGVEALIQKGLLMPDNAYNINDTAFVIGESTDLTVVVDCSAMSQTGRLTVIVSHTNDLLIARQLADSLISRIR